ncbi:MAG: hypothetical protein GEU87_20785 [Alphaproteobacteria bacterium]|nr:hypothetical protein [Alphaproteobacteria bacterium]
MIDTIAGAVFNYLTPITVLVALFVPSVWIAAAAGMSVAMIGVIGFTHGQPTSQVVAAWLIGQVCTGILAHVIGRKAR